MIQNTLLVIKLLIKIHNYEYIMEDLKRIKRNNWVAKHPDTVQNISAAFGGILSKMAGGGRHTGGLHLPDGDEVESFWDGSY